MYLHNSNNAITPNFIRKLHHFCFAKTKSFAGVFRNMDVVVRDKHGIVIHQGAPAQKVAKLVEELCAWYDQHKTRYPPLLLASIVHNQYETIRPFQDGNGRAGRLLLNHVLLQHKYPPINIRLKDRTDYYFVLQEYQRKDRILPTLKFLIRQYRKQYR